MAIQGLEFMQEMIQMSKRVQTQPPAEMERVVQLISEPWLGTEHFLASPAQFGPDLAEEEVVGESVVAKPYNGCSIIENAERMAGRIGIVRRGECMFQEKIRHLQSAGAIAAIVIDNHRGTSAQTAPMFAMSADEESVEDIQIPAIFLFHHEGQKLLNRIIADYRIILRLSYYLLSPQFLLSELLQDRCCWRTPLIRKNDLFVPGPDLESLTVHLRLYPMAVKVTRRELIDDQYAQLSTGILFYSQTEVNLFKYFCIRVIDSVLDGKSDVHVDGGISDEFPRIFANARLQPTMSRVRISHSVFCEFPRGGFRCKIRTVQSSDEHNRVSQISTSNQRDSNDEVQESKKEEL